MEAWPTLEEIGGRMRGRAMWVAHPGSQGGGKGGVENKLELPAVWEQEQVL